MHLKHTALYNLNIFVADIAVIDVKNADFLLVLYVLFKVNLPSYSLCSFINITVLVSNVNRQHQDGTPLQKESDIITNLMT